MSGVSTDAAPGLSPLVKLGTTDLPPLPPAPPQDAAFPPAFATTGGPPEAVGVWWDDAKRTGELVGYGTLSSVALQPDNIFLTVLGRFNSYKCKGAGSYEASLSYTLQPEAADALSSGIGCTVGRVDLDASTYTWQPASDFKCPDLSAPGSYSMKRIGESEV